MKGDPPTLAQIVEKYGDPADKLVAMCLDSLARADLSLAAGDVDEAREWRLLAGKCRKELAEYGFVAGEVGGVPKAIRPPKRGASRH